MMVIGCYHDAIRLFRSDLKEMLSSIYVDSCDDGVDGGSLVAQIETIPCQLNESICLDHSLSTIFAKAAVVRKSFLHCADDASKLCPATRKHSAVAYVFNIALAYHLLAYKSESAQEKTIRKAVRMYEIALAVIKKIVPRDSGMNVIELAILNNLGHIFSSYFFDIQKVRACFSAMEKILQSQIDSDEAMEDILEFHHSALLFTNSLMTAAPAA